MKLSHDACYKALKSHDARFDGVFYTAVKSTGIYCRPICKVPAPKSENCEFYASPVKAESNGYRPCLRCRPELAPGYADVEQRTTLLGLLIHYFESENFQPGLVKKSAEEFGITPRHVFRVFQQIVGVSPQKYIMTRRLLNAKQLLTDTQMPVTDVAYQSGFGSVSRLHAAIKEHYGLTANAIRKQKKRQINEDGITLKLSYRPPYDWETMLDFFKLRAIPLVEHVTDSGVYMRSLQLNKNNRAYKGWIKVRPNPETYTVELVLSQSLENVILDVIHRVRRVFDLDAVPELLPEGIPKGIRLPGSFDPFEMSVRAVLGQQITVKAARTLAGRVALSMGDMIETPWNEIARLFPTATDIQDLGSELESIFGKLGVIKTRSQTIQSLARKMNNQELRFEHYGEFVDDLKTQLITISGIGQWTAEYLIMRILSWPDAFPVSDIGVKHALLSGKFMENTESLKSEMDAMSKYKADKLYELRASEYAEMYKPWRSYLTISLWNAL